jgi:hypothetical protein
MNYASNLDGKEDDVTHIVQLMEKNSHLLTHPFLADERLSIEKSTVPDADCGIRK